MHLESKIVDARGMACPMPVINTKKVLEAMAEGSVTTIVDNEAAKENVFTLAKGMGLEVEIRQEEGEYHLLITKKGGLPLAEANFTSSNVIFVQSSEFGRGSTELGNILMKSFMFTLMESDTPPQCLLFVNSGVYLTCNGSPVLEHLLNLAERGVKILSCGTCLDYFKLKEQLAVGQVTNMYTIYEEMNKADKVISL